MEKYNNLIMQKKHSFDKDTIIKILKGAGIAGGGVASVYILQGLAVMDFAEYSAVVAGVCAILINAIREFLKGEDLPVG